MKGQKQGYAKKISLGIPRKGAAGKQENSLRARIGKSVPPSTT